MRFYLLLFFTGWLLRPVGAQQWQPVNGVPGGQVTVLLPVGDTLFAAGPNRLFRSYDAGASWIGTAVINPGLDFITALSYEQGRLYVGTVVDGVFSSNDGGQGWQADNNGLVGPGAKAISSLAVRGDSLYTSTYGAGVFVKKISTNSGWSVYNAGMPWGNVERLNNIDGRLFAGAGGNGTFSLQATPDHSWTEQPFAVFNGSLNVLLCVVKQGNVLLAAGSSGLYRSEDEGSTWSYYNAGTGLLGSARFAVQGSRVIANLAKPVGKTFLLYTDDRGLTWQPLEPQITTSYGYDLAVCGGYLYSARDNGLWRLDLTTPTVEPWSPKATLGQNFPNPASDATTIPFTLPTPGRVALAVFDLSGARVFDIPASEQPAGEHTFQLSVRDLPPGVYICQLTTPATQISRKLTIAR